jgi:hypothetical protein
VKGFATGAGLAVAALAGAALWFVWKKKQTATQGALEPGETRGGEVRPDMPAFFARIMSETSDPPETWDIEMTNNDPVSTAPIDFKLRLKVHNVSPFGTGNGDGVPFHVSVPPFSSSVVRVESGVPGSPFFIPALWKAEVVLDNPPLFTSLGSVIRPGV